MPKHILLFIYNSFNDPIVQGSVLTYIKRYKNTLDGHSVFSLVTFEQKEYEVSPSQEEQIKLEFKKWEIDWYPLKYHTGGWLTLPKKFYDLFGGFLTVKKIQAKKNIDLIYTVGSIGGSMGFILSKIFSTEMLVHTFEPHSEFMVDFTIWRKRSLSFKTLNYMEKVLVKQANYLMTGTNAMINRINKTRKKAGVYRVPSCVNLEKFKPNKTNRLRIREKLALEDRLILLYLGKFGGIYFNEEPFLFFKHFLNFFGNHSPHILIITPNDRKWVISSLQKKNITNSYTILRNIPFTEIQDYINAADIGYCGIPPLPSQKYRSPIKNGEYLACGVPYIVYEGVSEDDQIARRENVGVVLQDNLPDSIAKSLQEITRLLQEDKQQLRTRCRQAAEKYRGIAQSDRAFKEVFE